jgi:hypothetical protein
MSFEPALNVMRQMLNKVNRCFKEKFTKVGFSYISLKGTVVPVWVWLKFVWGDRKYFGEEPLRVFKIFSMCLWFFIDINRNAAPSEEMNGNCHVLANSHWAILPPLLLAGSGYLGISQRLPITFKNRPEAF